MSSISADQRIEAATRALSNETDTAFLECQIALKECLAPLPTKGSNSAMAHEVASKALHQLDYSFNKGASRNPAQRLSAAGGLLQALIVILATTGQEEIAEDVETRVFRPVTELIDALNRIV